MLRVKKGKRKRRDLRSAWVRGGDWWGVPEKWEWEWEVEGSGRWDCEWWEEWVVERWVWVTERLGFV